MRAKRAIVLMKPDGAVSALIGGRDYDDSVFNRATQAHRQPGSAFKPFVYLAALENGITPWDMRDDGPVDINGWTPTNYGGRELRHHHARRSARPFGQHDHRRSRAGSRHHHRDRCGASLRHHFAAGAERVAGARHIGSDAARTHHRLRSVRDRRHRVSPYYVTEVDRHRGSMFSTSARPPPQRVIAPHVDRDLTRCSTACVQGTGRSAALSGHEAAGKTGTTQEYHDAWFVGFTPDYVAGVWVGNDDYSPMKNVTGGTFPAAIWQDVMTAAEQGFRQSRSTNPRSHHRKMWPIRMATMIRAQVPAATMTKSQQGDGQSDHRTFWDWLFGRGQPPGHDEQSPPPLNHRIKRPHLHLPPRRSRPQTRREPRPRRAERRMRQRVGTLTTTCRPLVTTMSRARRAIPPHRRPTLCAVTCHHLLRPHRMTTTTTAATDFDRIVI